MSSVNARVSYKEYHPKSVPAPLCEALDLEVPVIAATQSESVSEGRREQRSNFRSHTNELSGKRSSTASIFGGPEI